HEEIRGTSPPRFGALARIEWQLYVQNSSPLIESGDATVFLDSADAALAEAQRMAALSGLSRLLQRPGALRRATPGVLLNLESVGSYSNYQQLWKALWALPGVSKVEPQRFLLPAGGAAEEQVR